MDEWTGAESHHGLTNEYEGQGAGAVLCTGFEGGLLSRRAHESVADCACARQRSRINPWREAGFRPRGKQTTRCASTRGYQDSSAFGAGLLLRARHPALLLKPRAGSAVARWFGGHLWHYCSTQGSLAVTDRLHTHLGADKQRRAGRQGEHGCQRALAG